MRNVETEKIEIKSKTVHQKMKHHRYVDGQKKRRLKESLFEGEKREYKS